MTAKEKKVIVVASAILAVAAVLAYCTRPAKAAEMKGQLFLPISARYIEDLGVGVGLGYVFESGLQLSGQVTYDRIDGHSGTTTCAIGCRNCQQNWAVPSNGQTGLTFTVGIPLGKKEAKK